VLQHSLDDSAAELMDTHLVDPGLERINYELYSVTGELLYHFLDHMVSVLVLHTFHHYWFQLINQVLLLDRSENFQSLLHYSAAVLVL
jgi:hypothetical protein